MMSLRRICVITIVAGLSFVGRVYGQPQCACFDGCTDKPAVDSIEAIDNIKKPDLVLCSTDLPNCQPVFKKLYGSNPDVLIEEVSDVSTANARIIARHTTLGHPLNVVLGGHGANGLFCFALVGVDSLQECIGNEPKWPAKVQANKDSFLQNLPGKIEHLVFASCEVAKGALGQGFIRKMQEALGASLVKAWTNKLWYAPDPWPDWDNQNGIFLELPGEKKDVPEPCCLADDTCTELTNADCVAAGGTPFAKGHTCKELEEKGTLGACAENIPAVSAWGVVVLLLLVAAAGTLVIRRSRAIA